jgi:hypothetical protein
MTLPTPLQATDRLALGAATALTRGGFLKRVGALALTATFATALLEFDLSRALAHGSCNTHPCGQNPLCPAGSCFQADCIQASPANCSTRAWNTACCNAATGTNTWCETCPNGSAWQGLWYCGDCCCPPNLGGDQCHSGCGLFGCGTKYSCICRWQRGTDGGSVSGCCNNCNDINKHTGECNCG